MRDETEDERADRKWTDLLQELRVIQTGVQLLAGFLLTLPFQDRFSDLDDVQRGTYLGLVALSGVTTTMVLAPIAIHRRVAGRHVKPRLVEIAHLATRPILAAVAMLIAGITAFVFDVVLGRAAGISVLVIMGLLVVVLLVLWPLRLVPRDDTL